MNNQEKAIQHVMGSLLSLPEFILQFQVNASKISSQLEKLFNHADNIENNPEFAKLLGITPIQLKKMIHIALEYQSHQNNRIDDKSKSVPSNIQCILQEEYLHLSGIIQSIYQDSII